MTPDDLAVLREMLKECGPPGAGHVLTMSAGYDRLSIARAAALSAAIAAGEREGQMGPDAITDAHGTDYYARQVLAAWDALDTVPADDPRPTEEHQARFDAVLNGLREAMERHGSGCRICQAVALAQEEERDGEARQDTGYWAAAHNLAHDLEALPHDVGCPRVQRLLLAFADHLDDHMDHADFETCRQAAERFRVAALTTEETNDAAS